MMVDQTRRKWWGKLAVACVSGWHGIALAAGFFAQLRRLVKRCVAAQPPRAVLAGRQAEPACEVARIRKVRQR